MQLNEAVDAFLRYLRTRKGRPMSTVNTYSGILGQFILKVGNKDVKNLSLEDVDGFADSLSLYGYTQKTLRNKMNAVRSFVKFLYIKDLNTLKPGAVDVPPEPEDNEADFLELEEAQALMSVIDDVRDRALILFMLATWGRASEVANVRIEDIHGRSVHIRRGKGGKSRPVFISEETEQAINAYIAARRGTDPGPLFPNPSGEKLSRQWISRRVCKYAAKAGINKKVSAHTLRHTGATAFLDAGGRLEVAQKILGHSKIETTMVYVHFKDERLHNDYDKTVEKLYYTKIG